MSRGMVVAPQPEAVEAGVEILRAGGNAVDAAVACGLVQGVVDPMMTGIAGFGSMHVYLPRRGVHTLIDFHGRAPAAARPDMWADLIERETRDGFGFVLRGRVNDVGYQSVTVPGSLKAYWEAQTAFGALDWKDVVRPAIEHADEGFVVRPHVHGFFTEPSALGRVDNLARLRASASGRRIYFTPSGDLVPLGGRVKNPDMAGTLRRIATGGADVFYTGDIAKQVASDMAANGGLVTLDDLRTYRTTWAEPLWGTYRGRRVATNRPPGGGVVLLQMLNVLGAPGGAHIAIAVLQALVNMIDFRMPVADAVAAPRFSAVSDVIDVANRIPRFVTRELEAAGHTVARSHLSYAFAAVHAIAIHGDRLAGGADPGRDGMALEA